MAAKISKTMGQRLAEALADPNREVTGQTNTLRALYERGMVRHARLGTPSTDELGHLVRSHGSVLTEEGVAEARRWARVLGMPLEPSGEGAEEAADSLAERAAAMTAQDVVEAVDKAMGWVPFSLREVLHGGRASQVLKAEFQRARKAMRRPLKSSGPVAANSAVRQYEEMYVAWKAAERLEAEGCIVLAGVAGCRAGATGTHVQPVLTGVAGEVHCLGCGKTGDWKILEAEPCTEERETEIALLRAITEAPTREGKRAAVRAVEEWQETRARRVEPQEAVSAPQAAEERTGVTRGNGGTDEYGYPDRVPTLFVDGGSTYRLVPFAPAGVVGDAGVVLAYNAHTDLRITERYATGMAAGVAVAWRLDGQEWEPFGKGGKYLVRTEERGHGAVAVYVKASADDVKGATRAAAAYARYRLVFEPGLSGGAVSGGGEFADAGATYIAQEIFMTRRATARQD